MDLDGLRRIVEVEKPKMLILCNPHNPIGLQWDYDTMAELASICRAAGVVVVSDEIHGDLLLYGRKHIPFSHVAKTLAPLALCSELRQKLSTYPVLSARGW